jgi:hypothetical protein
MLIGLVVLEAAIQMRSSLAKFEDPPLAIRRFSEPIMRTRHLILVFAVACAASVTPAMGQWAWRDASNQLVFSDRPPPPGIKPAQIVRQPGPNAPLDLSPAPAVIAKPANAPAGVKSLAEREMEFRKRQQEKELAEQKSTESAARAAELAQECQRLRGYLRTLEDGVNIVRDDGQGNRKYLDDGQRQEEIKRLRDGLARNCNSG